MDASSSGSATAILRGVRGWVDGERYHLSAGSSVVIGRSRSCDISLRRIVAYLERPAGERDNDHDFNTVSRRHLRIDFDGHSITVEDLSTNGSYCNGELLTAPLSVEITDSPVQLRLGTRECFELGLGNEAADSAERPETDSDIRQPAG